MIAKALRPPRMLCCAALILVFLLPFLLSLALRADFINLASESLAYRFFYALRNLAEADPSAWLPQGQLASAIQSAWLWLIMHAVSPDAETLRSAMNAFGVLSLASFNLIGVATLILAFRSRLGAAELACFAVFIVSITYCIKHNYGMLLWPDYYLLNVNLVLAALFLFLRRREDAAAPTMQETLIAGLFTGLLAANKINMVMVAAPYLWLLFLNCNGAKRKLTLAAQVGLLTVLVWSLVFFAAGGFRLSWLRQVLPNWYQFLTHPGGDDGFDALPYLVSIYEMAGLIVLTGFGAALLNLRTRRDAWLFGGIAAAFLVNAMAVLKRPAGTTMFDMALVELVFGFASLSLLRDAKWKTRLVAALGLLALLDAGLSFPVRRFWQDLAESRARADEQWDFFHQAMQRADHRPVTYYLPDNSHQFGDVFIVMLKGGSAFPTWATSEGGRKALDAFAPQLQFRFDGSMPGPSDPATTPVLVWMDKAGAVSLDKRHAPLASALHEASHREVAPMPTSDVVGHIVERRVPNKKAGS